MAKSTAPRACSIADALELVGERWSLLAVREILHGVRRFDEIVRNTGASRDILTTRLRKLESGGVVRREQYSERPPRFEYHLTTAGKEVGDVLLTLMRWGDRHLNPDDPPVRWLHSCGEVLDPVVVCNHCGEPARNNVHTATGRGVLVVHETGSGS
ncbi:helix-turn-helix domain-containing protein [Streptomyces sp. NPDC006283]|uniref:winged helix-turn-helix transcriptional regulator n=1 Tax=Streptomyces sp. NPDC006283 TaxID=3156741 RepID=UPI0033B3C2AE